jgi:hypothetical protein
MGEPFQESKPGLLERLRERREERRQRRVWRRERRKGSVAAGDAASVAKSGMYNKGGYFTKN